MATSENICGLKREDFITTVQGKQTDLYVLRNANGAEIAVTNFGGAIAAIMVPDKDGNMANVIQGHDNINDYINTTEPFLSTLIGRFGNRIKEGKFTMTISTQQSLSSLLSSVVSATVLRRVSSSSTARSITWLSTMVLTISTVVQQVIMRAYGMLSR